MMNSRTSSISISHAHHIQPISSTARSDRKRPSFSSRLGSVFSERGRDDGGEEEGNGGGIGGNGNGRAGREERRIVEEIEEIKRYEVSLRLESENVMWVWGGRESERREGI